MTWTKTTAEFPDDCAEAGLTDAAYRTHHEAVTYVYNQENIGCTVRKSTMRRWAGSDRSEAAAAELTGKGWWIDRGGYWEIVHDADVIRQSIAAQQKKRERDKKAQQSHRLRASAISDDVSADTFTDASDDISAGVSGDTDRHTDSSEQPGSEDEQINYQTGEVLSFDPWAEPTSSQHQNPSPKASGNPSKCSGCGLPMTSKNPQCPQSADHDWRKSA